MGNIDIHRHSKPDPVQRAQYACTTRAGRESHFRIPGGFHCEDSERCEDSEHRAHAAGSRAGGFTDDNLILYMNMSAHEMCVHMDIHTHMCVQAETHQQVPRQK